MNHRGQLTTINTILANLASRKSRTEIVYRTRISWNQVTPLINTLLEKALITKLNGSGGGRNDQTVPAFVRTEKGTEYMQQYEKLVEFLN